VWHGEFWNRRQDGALIYEKVSIAPVKDDTGAIVNYVAITEDITQRRKREAAIWKQANYDILTGVANRGYFTESLHEAILRAQRNKSQLALLFIDLDDFKPVNDSYGHEVGDQLLQCFVERLKGLLRESDMVGRIGGDEFAVIIEGLAAPLPAGDIHDKLAKDLSKPYWLEQEGEQAPARFEVRVGASIGVALYPQDGQSGDALLHHADQDMYRIKAQRKRS